MVSYMSVLVVAQLPDSVAVWMGMGSKCVVSLELMVAVCTTRLTKTTATHAHTHSYPADDYGDAAVVVVVL